MLQVCAPNIPCDEEIFEKIFSGNLYDTLETGYSIYGGTLKNIDGRRKTSYTKMDYVNGVVGGAMIAADAGSTLALTTSPTVAGANAHNVGTQRPGSFLGLLLSIGFPTTGTIPSPIPAVISFSNLIGTVVNTRSLELIPCDFMSSFFVFATNQPQANAVATCVDQPIFAGAGLPIAVNTAVSALSTTTVTYTTPAGISVTTTAVGPNDDRFQRAVGGVLNRAREEFMSQSAQRALGALASAYSNVMGSRASGSHDPKLQLAVNEGLRALASLKDRPSNRVPMIQNQKMLVDRPTIDQKMHSELDQGANFLAGLFERTAV